MKRNEKTCAEIAQNMQSYVAPEIEVLKINVENGFGGSFLQQEPSYWEDM